MAGKKINRVHVNFFPSPNESKILKYLSSVEGFAASEVVGVCLRTPAKLRDFLYVNPTKLGLKLEDDGIKKTRTHTNVYMTRNEAKLLRYLASTEGFSISEIILACLRTQMRLADFLSDTFRIKNSLKDTHYEVPDVEEIPEDDISEDDISEDE